MTDFGGKVLADGYRAEKFPQIGREEKTEVVMALDDYILNECFQQ